MKALKSSGLVFSLLIAISIIAGAQSEDERLPVPITVYFRDDSWIMAPPVVEDPASPNSGSTQSIFLAVRRAFNPDTGESYDNSEPPLSFRVEDVRHFFRLEKKEFLLGEPILVEHRIELNGPGQWQWFIGGNYRARGRDDNFTCVMKRTDGTIVPDPYPKIEGWVVGGGLGSDQTITQEKPHSYWLGLQRYSAITEPGTYDLYCMTGHKEIERGKIAAMRAVLPPDVSRDHYVDDAGRLIDAATKQPSERYRIALNEEFRDSKTPWPLLSAIPEDVLAAALGTSFREGFASSLSFGIVSHFQITIREGSPAEQVAMSRRWTQAAEGITKMQLMGSHQSALRDAVWYSKRDNFLPLLERWITTWTGPDYAAAPLQLDSLAMRPDDAAFALLLKAPTDKITNAFFSLHASRIPEAIPLCIDWLTHQDNQVRAQAESHLTRWTGQSFEHSWTGYHYQRPTPAEGQSMQKLWRAWWKANQVGFKPCPCDKKEETK